MEVRSHGSVFCAVRYLLPKAGGAMNIASLAPCKRLYELSEWEPEHREWWGLLNGGYKAGISEVRQSGRFNSEEIICPAYDLGFLLRKLPKSHRPPDGYVDLFSLYLIDDDPAVVLVWAAGYGSQLAVEADTPENAACELAIKLIEQGIIQP